ncbi:uncharacterized protein GLRG_10732 [Colletotrichum graminicola M1.001]|uniref:DUF7702 domain-containing protein n=1 Tax=Colletotrichum graminicola (strain M1.001 / M2 / FGSC 10212) TaxID=645133 RepID=E3QXK0_COLGM|nr:uncharacterized protein GLRG_10732 [Colletotrichum graminicola M1.001]EFQ35588.1 hypothetical protein GLRG_10732 [Colletotrichum graminicola M1.001]
MAREFRYRDGVAIAQIIIFSIFPFFGILFRVQKKMGWFGVSFISTIRIIGAGCMLGTITNNSRAVWATIFVCESLGLVILTFTLLDLLKRVNSFIQILTSWHFRIPELICWAGLAISIADYALASRKADNAMAPGSLTKAGVGLFVALYFWGVLLFILLARKWKQVPQSERRSLIGFASCFPFMVVRISYTIAYVSTGERRFSAVNGDTTTYLFMTMLMEFAVLACVVCTVWGLDRLYQQVKDPGSTNRDGSELEDLVDSSKQRVRGPES